MGQANVKTKETFDNANYQNINEPYLNLNLQNIPSEKESCPYIVIDVFDR
jgi:hypothetical protein